MERRSIVSLTLIVAPLLLWAGWKSGLFHISSSEPSTIIGTPQAAQAKSGDTAPTEFIQLPTAAVDIPETTNNKNGIPVAPPDVSSQFHFVTDFTADALWMAKENSFDKLLLWHARTGTLQQFQYPDPKRILLYGKTPTLFAVPAGLILQGGQYQFANKWYTDHARIVLLTRTNEVVVGRLNIARENPQFLLLADGSLLVVGGITSSDKVTRTNAVEHVSYADGKLVVEQMADLSGEVRRGVSLVQRADGSVLAAGGSTSRFMGTAPMTDQTYILDFATKSWHEGPKLKEPRTDAASILLPDGTVMVTGGWTPSQTWQEEASRTTETLKPASNHFDSGPLLPLGIASHQAAWVEDGLKKQHLFLLGGIVKAHEASHAMHEYDLGNVEWRTVADGCVPIEYAQRVRFALFAASGQNIYLWCHNPNQLEGYAGQWSFVAPRLLDSAAEDAGRMVPNAGLALRRYSPAFIPQQGSSPALIAGGSISGAPSAAAESISANGQVAALGTLNIARSGAQIFRLQDGSFIVSGGTRGRTGSRDDAIQSMEWLPAGQPLDKARWRMVDSVLPSSAVIGQLTGGKLLSVDAGGVVKLISFSHSTPGGLVMNTTAMPSLTRDRQRLTDGSESIKLKDLSDGRIIVAGGSVPQQRIALLQEDSLDAQAVDNYIDFGSYVNAHTYEIYNPLTGAWSESAPSRLEGGLTAILDDGRVIKWGVLNNEPSTESSASNEPRGLLEVSSPDGSSWQEWPVQPLISVSNPREPARPFVIEGELFLSGTRTTDQNTAGPTIVQWFDNSTKQWSTVWEAAPDDPWRKHLGRFIVRQLSNGKRIVLPVAGF